MANRESIELGKFDIRVKRNTGEYGGLATFFFNYQRDASLWAVLRISDEVSVNIREEVLVIAPGSITKFPALVTLNFLSGTLSISPLIEPVESHPLTGLKELSLALLDYPLMDGLMLHRLHPRIVLRSGNFNVIVTKPTRKHEKVSTALGSAPHKLTDSVVIRERSGKTFNSGEAKSVLDILHTTLSFAAGRWVGMTLVEGVSNKVDRRWFQWGTRRLSRSDPGHSWYDPAHPEWLTTLCDAFLQLKSDEETWDTVGTALYWYQRSNTRQQGGQDGSLILSQCALELLSWFVIVRDTGALSESGYGQLDSAAERLRLALTLLGIPVSFPPGLTELAAFKDQVKKPWKNVADAVVESRNYLVHPTQGRTGKRRAKMEYPWYELWLAAQWLLELVILRMLGYNGDYRNRTRYREVNDTERVPWAQT